MGWVFGHISPMCGSAEWAEPRNCKIGLVKTERVAWEWCTATKDKRTSHAPVSHAMRHVSLSTILILVLLLLVWVVHYTLWEHTKKNNLQNLQQCVGGGSRWKKIPNQIQITSRGKHMRVTQITLGASFLMHLIWRSFEQCQKHCTLYQFHFLIKSVSTWELSKKLAVAQEICIWLAWTQSWFEIQCDGMGAHFPHVWIRRVGAPHTIQTENGRVGVMIQHAFAKHKANMSLWHVVVGVKSQRIVWRMVRKIMVRTVHSSQFTRGQEWPANDDPSNPGIYTIHKNSCTTWSSPLLCHSQIACFIGHFAMKWNDLRAVWFDYSFAKCLFDVCVWHVRIFNCQKQNKN